MEFLTMSKEHVAERTGERREEKRQVLSFEMYVPLCVGRRRGGSLSLEAFRAERAA